MSASERPLTDLEKLTQVLRRDNDETERLRRLAAGEVPESSTLSAARVAERAAARSARLVANRKRRRNGRRR